MDATLWLRPNLPYVRALVEAGVEGISGAMNELNGRIFAPTLRSSVWKPMAICGAIGALGSQMSGKRNRSRTVAGGALGALVGFGATAAWTSRRFTDCAARKASRLVADTRDRHWLETHPIDYA